MDVVLKGHAESGKRQIVFLLDYLGGIFFTYFGFFSDYLLDDDHNVTTGSVFVSIYSRIVFCTFCFFSISFLKGFFLQKQESLLDVYPKRFDDQKKNDLILHEISFK